MRWLFPLLAVILLAAPACGQESTPAAAPGFVRVTVTAGPQCPVVKQGDRTCADRPVVGAALELARGGGPTIVLHTDARGIASSPGIPAGTYTLTAGPVMGLMGTPRPVRVRVRAARTTSLKMVYDTGIR
ncbi:MAG: hypothetical protein ACXVYV_02930 [Gaiellales bacterium]